jgi:hypothetical protein
LSNNLARGVLFNVIVGFGTHLIASAPHGVVTVFGAQADHRRLPDAARRLVRAGLAQAAHLAKVETSHQFRAIQ